MSDVLPRATAGTQDVRLRKALMGHASFKDGLAISTTSTFEALPSGAGVSVPLSGRGEVEFSAHHTFRLPREGGQPHECDVVHRFSVRTPHDLNAGIREWALHREHKANAARHDILARTGLLSQIKDLGKIVSNRGGYQSHPDLFSTCDPTHASKQRGGTGGKGAKGAKGATGLLTEAADELTGLRHCRELHRVASEALDQLSRDQTVQKNGREGVPEGWNAAQCKTPTRFHQASAWLNVNRADDVNLLHVHPRDKLSATYYVTAGAASRAPLLGGRGESASNLDGCLVFRAGASVRADGRPAETSHSYMNVPPVPGALWIFPGSVPHVVMGMSQPDGTPSAADDPTHSPCGLAEILSHQASKILLPNEPERLAARDLCDPRISVAMNFSTFAAPR